MSEQTQPDLELKQLGQFIGSENHFREPLSGLLYTDGIAYLMENGYSWFVTDAMIAIRFKKLYEKDDFLSVKLKVKADHTATMIIDDGNGSKPYYTQRYGYTDAKQDLNLFFEGRTTLLLSSEH